MMTSSKPRYLRIVAAASLILGPLLMSVGDLIHPAEDANAADQVAVIFEDASRWYTAHLLLFIGLVVLIPGILALTGLTAERKPAVGYTARVLVLAGVAAFCAVFVAEMLIGRYISDGASVSAATELLETFQSGWVLGVVMVGGVAWFAGVAMFAIPLIMTDGGLRWPAAIYGLGALLILVEIMTSQVLLSQIGNVVLLAASLWFAWHILQRDRYSVSA